ncbi:MAG: hypothetical protein PVJ76_15655 [Gemmatimonadota bacterium]|jgi:hypothetical protein
MMGPAQRKEGELVHLPRNQIRSAEDGIALITTLLVVLITGALVMGAIILGSNHLLVDRHWLRQSALVGLADSGLEMARAHLNAGQSLFPDSGYVVFEDGVSVRDGSGEVIPGVERWTYLGPSRGSTGRDGVSGSVVSVVKDGSGGVAIRRQEVFQESFAKYAYFTDNEGGGLYFADNDHIWGPVHTNDQMSIHSTRARFHDEVTTAKEIDQSWYGIFDKGYREFSPVIPMPGRADLGKLRKHAQAGHTHIIGDTEGEDGEATTRIEFIAVDLNEDGDESDEDEGFFRVYQSSDYEWVSAKPQPREACSYQSRGLQCDTVYDLVGTYNCGDYHNGVFVPAADHDPAVHGHDGLAALESPSRRCYLGGADEIWNGFVADDGKGRWLQWNGPVDGRLRAVRPADADYLWPITRPNNPDFKGVIFVDGKAIVSGRIRGRITLAATDNIIFGDDLTYVTDPGAGTCGDIAGYLAGERVVVSNNAINAAWQPAAGESYRTYDESTGEFFHGVVLALDIFTAEEATSGSASAQHCEGRQAGRGCIYLTGGIIQETRGAVGSADGHGYVKRYSYDRCAATEPPPYFPTTGAFLKGQYYQVEPVGFDVDQFFSAIASGNRADTGN